MLSDRVYRSLVFLKGNGIWRVGAVFLSLSRGDGGCLLLGNGSVVPCALGGAVEAIGLVRGRVLAILLREGCAGIVVCCWFLAMDVCL